jgi:hypothetical protein
MVPIAGGVRAPLPHISLSEKAKDGQGHADELQKQKRGCTKHGDHLIDPADVDTQQQ